MLGQTIFSGYFSLAVIFIFVRHVLRTSGMELVLTGLTAYHCIDPTKLPQGSKPDDTRNNKKGARKQAERRQLELQGAENEIYGQPLTESSLRMLPFHEELDVMVMLAFSVVLNATMIMLLAAFFNLQASVVATSVTGLMMLYLTYVLFKADTLGESSRSWLDTAVLAGCIATGFLASLALLLWVPNLSSDQGGSGLQGPVLDFQLPRAARGLDAMMDTLTARVSARLGVQPQPSAVSPVALAGGVSVWSGVLAACLLGPALRFARLLHAALTVPPWGVKYMNHSLFATKAMQAAAVAPLLVVCLQVRPLIAYWGLPQPCVLPATAMALLLVAATQLAALPHLCQTYLHSGLVHWFTLLHNGISFEGKAAVVRRRLDMIRVLVGKATVQLLAPGLLALNMGLLLVLHMGTLSQVAHLAAGPRQQLMTTLASTGVQLPWPMAASLPAAPALNASLTHMHIHAGNQSTSPAVLKPGWAVEDEQQGSGAGVTAGAAAGLEGTGRVEGPAVAAAGPQGAAGLEGLTEDGSLLSMGSEDSRSSHTLGEKSSLLTSQGRAGKDAKLSLLEAAEAEGDDARQRQAGQSADFFAFVAVFYGWWACAVWCLYSFSGLAIYRLGMNVG
ncbi:hypothetical protein QJQ45_016535 [Haematococcus lacustris]|nr:hypothetical protein QJQ45_021526 [Haematococcus lacustris]KAJ9506937.1 hypothetical protein QJQ45_016535 [Haematococcus lacustris]